MRQLLPGGWLLLQTDSRHSGPATGAGFRHYAVLIWLCGALYGACMGSFGGISHGHWMQMVFSAVKVPLLLQACFVLSLPSFFVLNTLFGVRDDFPMAVTALTASHAALTTLLASLAPLTLLWTVSTSDRQYQATVLFNAAMFGTAAAGGQVLLRRRYRPLIAKDIKHRALLRVWGTLYSFTAIQMAWVLRPFVGDPIKPVRFFREDAWGNAYVEITNMMVHLLRK